MDSGSFIVFDKFLDQIKMQEHYHPVTLIDLSWPRPPSDSNHGDTDSVTNGDASCSGLVIDGRHGFILTHASILGPYLSDYPNQCENIQKVKYTTNPRKWPVSVKVLVQKHTVNQAVTSSPRYQPQPNQNTHDFNKRYYTELLNCTQSSLEQHSNLQPISEKSAKINSVFKVESFAQTVEKILPRSEGWTMVDNGPDSDKASSKLDMSFLLPYFVIIKLENPVRFSGFSIHRGQVTIGEPVTVIGTPFATLSPEIFMNSYSEGIISNVAGECHII